MRHTEVDADGPRDEVAVAVAARASVDGAGIHAGAAADAVQQLVVLLVGDDAGAPIVYDDEVQLPALLRLAEGGGVGRRGLPRGATGQ